MQNGSKLEQLIQRGIVEPIAANELEWVGDFPLAAGAFGVPKPNKNPSIQFIVQPSFHPNEGLTSIDAVCSAQVCSAQVYLAQLMGRTVKWFRLIYHQKRIPKTGPEISASPNRR